jgi:hypothetical protein
MPRIWQEIDADCHPCHWWQDLNRSSITAMTLTGILLLALTLLLTAAVLVGLVALVGSDGARTRRTDPPRSHPADPFDPRSRLA